MSDLKPCGVKCMIGGQERNLLFTINAIDSIQEKCNMPLFDTIKYIAKAADGNTEHDTLVQYRAVVTALLNDENDGSLTEKEVGKMITIENYRAIAENVLGAFGLSMPDPDEGDDMEDDEDEDHPNVETGQ